jgi:hypothetical protein
MEATLIHDKTVAPTGNETQLRQRLGIPPEADKIIIFAESSHWDPNWLRTSVQYYERFVERNLERALAELEREPRRIYSIESIFFLRMYWDRQPGQQETVRHLVNKGRLRITNSGVTTADTLLPAAEAILRDFLIGQEWLRANGMHQEPRLAYFTDSFGCSPALPSILQAAGFEQAAITRVDGMWFGGCDYEPSFRFPRPGSSAELLKKDECTFDFVWRSPDGAEVLCHWNGCTYGQGDLLAYRGVSRVYLFPLAILDRSDRNIRRRIKQYASQLLPYARTPYLFCPIGFDFVPPIPGLVELLDRYNERHYPRTGIWAVNAGLDDYLDLVDCHREVLPVLELDPNPYWTGFYTARPTLKKECHDLVDRLLLAEQLALLPENDGDGGAPGPDLHDAWWTAVTANHHDFITGTSPDRVVEVEQRPWLEAAMATAHAAVESLAPAVAPAAVPEAPPAGSQCPEWHRRDGQIEIHTPYYHVELDEKKGGGIVRARDASGHPLLADVSADLVLYRDSGGLWRMGHEFRGGRLREAGRASDRPAPIEVREHPHGLEVIGEATFGRLTLRRLLWFRDDSPLVQLRVEGRIPDRRTVTIRFQTAISSSQLAMGQPGGVVVRPPHKFYEPTFWPLQYFLHLQDDEGGHGLALFVRLPGAVTYRRDGRLEVVAVRNATRERAFGFIPFPATPARGRERRIYAFDHALLFTSHGDWRENGIGALAHTAAYTPWSQDGDEHLRRRAEALVTADRPDVFVTAVKPASRGEGLIVRLQSFAPPETPLTLAIEGAGIEAATLCDARERDLESLAVHDGAVALTMPGTIATVRLHRS